MAENVKRETDRQITPTRAGRLCFSFPTVGKLKDNPHKSNGFMTFNN